MAHLFGCVTHRSSAARGNQSNLVHTEVKLQNRIAVHEMGRDDVGRSRHNHVINGQHKGGSRMERLSILVLTQMRDPRGHETDCICDMICERSDCGKFCTWVLYLR